MLDVKEAVKAFWEEESCGERSAIGDNALDRQAAERYRVEPYLPAFAKFHEGVKQSVLEIGVGMGADHLEWAKQNPTRLCGIDLTNRAIEFTQDRLSSRGFRSELRVGDAESLPYPDDSFDIVWSWGVLHHTPNTQLAIDEVLRVLKPGGRARVMLYHRYGLAFTLIWLRHSLLVGRPFRSRQDVLSAELESIGTKAYSRSEVLAMFSKFSQVVCTTVLTHGDLLDGPIGRRHGGLLLSTMKRVWPRRMIRLVGDRLGSDLLIEAVK